MAYMKPEVIAKSEAKESFVAGCPEKTCGIGCHTSYNTSCMRGLLR